MAKNKAARRAAAAAARREIRFWLAALAVLIGWGLYRALRGQNVF